jgi:hypothetical protein
MAYKDLEKRLETQRRWQDANRDKVRASVSKYMKKKREDPGFVEREREHRKLYYYENQEEQQRKSREYMRQYYLNHKEELDQRNREKYAKRRLWFESFLSSQKCSVCGFSDPECLDFHHKNPSTKDYCITQILSFSIERINREMEKCIILCANCHRKEHAKMRRNNLTLSTQ